MTKLFLYLGIFLICSGIGSIIGVSFLMVYFWSDIKNELRGQKTLTEKQEEFGIDSMSEKIREEMR
ncbi:MAG: hypothetical protein CXT78_02895 [Thaumarchaeota archaeon]|jgi:hypothetical protein|nr:MAG: hypothetical protein CXT78_02895 [Nitrososphaerota archaeon]